jgi:hypothetical protein
LTLDPSDYIISVDRNERRHHAGRRKDASRNGNKGSQTG